VTYVLGYIKTKKLCLEDVRNLGPLLKMLTSSPLCVTSCMEILVGILEMIRAKHVIREDLFIKVAVDFTRAMKIYGPVVFIALGLWILDEKESGLKVQLFLLYHPERFRMLFRVSPQWLCTVLGVQRTCLTEGAIPSQVMTAMNFIQTYDGTSQWVYAHRKFPVKEWRMRL